MTKHHPSPLSPLPPSACMLCIPSGHSMNLFWPSYDHSSLTLYVGLLPMGCKYVHICTSRRVTAPRRLNQKGDGETFVYEGRWALCIVAGPNSPQQDFSYSFFFMRKYILAQSSGPTCEKVVVVTRNSHTRFDKSRALLVVSLVQGSVIKAGV